MLPNMNATRSGSRRKKSMLSGGDIGSIVTSVTTVTADERSNLWRVKVIRSLDDCPSSARGELEFEGGGSLAMFAAST
jgi:hypothetical protein